MFAKAVGYLIAGMLIVVPVGFAVWLTYDRVNILTSTTLHKATIDHCHYRQVKKKNRRKSSWAPVAVTVTGVSVKGHFYWSQKHWCQSSVGKQVSVFIHSHDASKNRINTFFQLWFLPVVLLFFCLVLYLGIYFLRKVCR